MGGQQHDGCRIADTSGSTCAKVCDCERSFPAYQPGTGAMQQRQQWFQSAGHCNRVQALPASTPALSPQRRHDTMANQLSSGLLLGETSSLTRPQAGRLCRCRACRPRWQLANSCTQIIRKQRHSLASSLSRLVCVQQGYLACRLVASDIPAAKAGYAAKRPGRLLP